MSNSPIEDPLKPLDKLCEPDKRSAYFVGKLEDIYAELSLIQLHEGVPLDVRHLFETAKNLCLYSWFAYRFHQVSELVAHSALEMALRLRYLSENPPDPAKPDQRPPALHGLMQHAKKHKWITNEGFPSLQRRAKNNAGQKKNIERMKNHDFEREPSMPYVEPNEEEVAEALAELDMVSAIANNANKVRNELAHGSSSLYPGSLSTLRLLEEIINQIFDPPAQD